VDPTLYVLEDGAGGCAEIWPAMGFNCIRWVVVRRDQTLELLFRDPAVFQGARPTRSGIPVLFPFPNRIRDGQFTFAGRTYRLPLNDPAKKNAIHGFACRVPWRVLETGADMESAWITAEFRCSIDAPDSLSLWPADHQIRLTIRLGRGTLRLEAIVSNPDTKPLPWGLGYHPYVRLPFTSEGLADDCMIEVPASEFWVLEGNLPTGERRSIDLVRDLNHLRPYMELNLDDVLTGLPPRAPRIDGLIERAAIHGAPGGPLRLFCAEAFHHLVVFTPPHRQAFCVEPYTCTTDAVNQTGDTGWKILAPGASVFLNVELWV
jgi:aldose 1-epimerase